MIRQLAFDLPAQEAWRREDFFVSPANAVALAAVDGWRDWPLGKLVLVGPEGSGKTHLARMWAAAVGARIVAGAELAGADIAHLAAGGPVVVEDAEAVAGNRQAEEALFHLHNMVVPQAPLLLTARQPARDWGITLPDLRSRMDAASLARLEPPDDALLAAVLVKLFGDRQVVVPAALIPWMVTRMERSLAVARRLVAALDARALAEGKPISRAMAAALLDSGDAE
ncbi:chromosomal replication initiator DnaA [Pseudotabrizicola sp. L79]|uniref:chromosomal replication initiator DnaA n=1 Tax=Pseudotabrizicola sp. L79 TaxID=3118402 RepID=UPI002F94A133